MLITFSCKLNTLFGNSTISPAFFDKFATPSKILLPNSQRPFPPAISTDNPGITVEAPTLSLSLTISSCAFFLSSSVTVRPYSAFAKNLSTSTSVLPILPFNPYFFLNFSTFFLKLSVSCLPLSFLKFCKSPSSLSLSLSISPLPLTMVFFSSITSLALLPGRK